MQSVSSANLLPEPIRSVPVGEGRDLAFATGIDVLAPVRGMQRRRSDESYAFDDSGAAAQTPSRPAAPPPRAVWEGIASGPWQAPASLAFAAQRFAQEEMTAGLHIEQFAPALRAYARAAGSGPAQSPAARDLGLPLWV